MKNQEEKNHSTTYGVYIVIWAALISLTALTVTISGLNLGVLTLAAALMIAGTKSLLVINYFMHVKFDQKVYKIFILLCVIVFVILIILTFTDYSFRQGI
jgi:cytochrome c oxidase subunit 4